MTYDHCRDVTCVPCCLVILSIYHHRFARSLNGGDTGRMSYPSGHATYSFCAATIMALYIWGKFRTFSQSSGKGNFPTAVLGLLPLAVSAFIAASYEFAEMMFPHCFSSKHS
mmetsp:Transcript_409/g.1257  ORF Transcript_409/g.1257 Transcript_409/m.1257 type:complete len:112 (+) Transcript_409:82-417(+)